MNSTDRFNFFSGDQGRRYSAFTSDQLIEEAKRQLDEEASKRAAEEGYISREENQPHDSSPVLTETEIYIGRVANQITESEAARIKNDSSDPLIVTYPVSGGTLWD